MKKLSQIFLGSKAIDFVLLELRNKEEMDAYYQLFLDCFGERSNVKQETFDWFNLQPPLYDNLTFAFIDIDESRMICSYGLLPVDTTVNGTILKCALCSNVMTHPDYTGIGLFQMIGKESLEFAKNAGISFAFGVPNEQAIKGHLKVGWEVVNELKFYENKPGRTSATSASMNAEISVNSLSEFRDSEFINIFFNKYKFYFNRSRKWMNWRLSKPLNDYITFTIADPEKFSFVVIKKFDDLKNNIRKLHIVDFGYEKMGSFIQLIEYCQQFARVEGFDLINLWQYAFNTSEIDELEKLGFNETLANNPIIIHKLGNDIDLPENDWHITLFDNDVY